MTQKGNDKIKLEDLPKSRPAVPEGYFETLSDRIMDRIDDTESKRVFMTPIRIFSVAASIILLFVLGIVFWPAQNSAIGTAEEILADVRTEDIIEYLDYADLTTSEILVALEIDEEDADEFIEMDIQLLDDSEFESIDEMELYEEFGIDEL